MHSLNIILDIHLDLWLSDPNHLFFSPLERPLFRSLLSARCESVRASAGLAAGCSANCAGGCAAQHLIIVRLHFDSADDKRKGGIIVAIEIYASGSLML